MILCDPAWPMGLIDHEKSLIEWLVQERVAGQAV